MRTANWASASAKNERQNESPRIPNSTSNGELLHLLTIEGLPRDILHASSTRAAPFTEVAEREVKKVPLLHGKSVFNLFFENSTRTRTTFEIAAKRLSADVVNLNIGASSHQQGRDPARHRGQPGGHACRHVRGAPCAERCAPSDRPASGAPENHIHVINAGDGRHAHPTQALLDMFTIRHYKKEFHNLRVAIVGDVLHSRVARSQIHALTTLGVPEVRVIAPKTLLPTAWRKCRCVQSITTWRKGLRDVDVVMMLRLQNERMQGAVLPSAQEYFKYYGLTQEKLALAKPDAIVMHPGPMNRGVEIDSSRGRRHALGHPAAGHLRYRGAHGGDEHALAGEQCNEHPYQKRSPH